MDWFLSFFGNDFDVPVENPALEATNIAKATGVEGIKSMMAHDSYGHPSPQLNMIKEVTLLSAFTGSLYGGAIHAQEAVQRFMRTNQATAFENPHTARRLLVDRATLGFGKGAWMWGWRMSIFSGSFLFISCAIPAYNGYHSVFDLACGSALAGMIYKFKQGPKPMIAGGAVGATLGVGAGCITAALLSVTGLTMDDIFDLKRQISRRALKAKHERLEQERKNQKESPLTESPYVS